MNHVWLEKNKDPKSVIVVFGGWAVGSDVLSHLKSTSDILFISDYRDLSYEFPDLSHYPRRILVAWSFGIAAYCHWQKNKTDIFDYKIAINGSMAPVDHAQGIPLEVMQKTIDTLSHDSFQVFLRRCHNSKMPDQTINVESRKAELIAVLERGEAPPQIWDRIWLSTKDRIFPLASMERAWAKQNDVIIKIEAPHVPFSLWESWDDIFS